MCAFFEERPSLIWATGRKDAGFNSADLLWPGRKSQKMHYSDARAVDTCKYLCIILMLFVHYFSDLGGKVIGLPFEDSLEHAFPSGVTDEIQDVAIREC